ncbi:hypothetical protein ACSBR2_004173 [Camellia fascicularis]
MLKVLDGEVEYDGFVDLEAFYVTFLVSYIIVLMGIIAIFMYDLLVLFCFGQFHEAFEQQKCVISSFY